MLRLVETPSAADDAPTTPDRPADYERQRAYRRLNQLIYRVLQLDDILHRRCAFNPEKAARIKAQIKSKQDELEHVFTEIDGGKRRRATMRLVER
ncbi:MAG: hypothetical protein GVY35_09825 [Bacteroidetes bacterium]|jgi:hypothetical protein|nr:hypothetical protein [Bacteroidota bacterium]